MILMLKIEAKNFANGNLLNIMDIYIFLGLYVET